MVGRLTKGLTKEEKSWILYDWASQGYVMIVMTVMFSLYFMHSTNLAGAEGALGHLSLANTVATIILGVSAPVLGTLSGYKGIKKLIFSLLACMGIIGTIGLAIVPEQWWFMLLVVFIVSSVGFSGANKIYDAFLVDVSKKENMNRVSTLGFGFAYVGGALPFMLGIPFVLLANSGTINMSIATAFRICFWIAGIWWIVFSIPMFKNVKQQVGVEKEKKFVRKSFIGVWTTFLDIAKHKHILIFLVAFFLYSDGLGSIIRLSTGFGSTIGLGDTDLIIILLVTQFVAFPSAIIYGKVSERIGTKNMIYFGIATYCIICMIALQMNPARDEQFLLIMFWILAMLVGTAQGGVQALSRSYFGRIVPKEKCNEYFGFYNIFSRFSSVIGTTSFAIIYARTGQPHRGIGVIAVLFIAAAIIFYFAPDDKKLAESE